MTRTTHFWREVHVSDSPPSRSGDFSERQRLVEQQAGRTAGESLREFRGVQYPRARTKERHSQAQSLHTLAQDIASTGDDGF
jgi:hypothetical protein